MCLDLLIVLGLGRLCCDEGLELKEGANRWISLFEGWSNQFRDCAVTDCKEIRDHSRLALEIAGWADCFGITVVSWNRTEIAELIWIAVVFGNWHKIGSIHCFCSN